MVQIWNTLNIYKIMKWIIILIITTNFNVYINILLAPVANIIVFFGACAVIMSPHWAHKTLEPHFFPLITRKRVPVKHALHIVIIGFQLSRHIFQIIVTIVKFYIVVQIEFIRRNCILSMFDLVPWMLLFSEETYEWREKVNKNII